MFCILTLAWYSQTWIFNLYQRSLVAAAAIYRNLSKNYESNKFIAALETVNKTRSLYSISEKAGIIIKFENLKARFGLNLSTKDYSDHKWVDASMLYWWKKEPGIKATLELAKENLSNSLVQVKGAGQKVLFSDLEMKIIHQAKKRRARKLCISTCWVKVTMMNLLKEHYFVDGTCRIHRSLVFITSFRWLLASMHLNNFLLKKRSNKRPKYLEEALLRCRIFHNGFRMWCKTHSGYVIFIDNPCHKYGAFTPECRYTTDQGPLPLVVGLYKTWDEKGKKVVTVSHPGAGLEKRQCSIQVTFRPRRVQPKTAVIFCGTGKRISHAERDLYADGDHVFWQKK